MTKTESNFSALNVRIAVWLRTASLIVAYFCTVLVIHQLVLADVFETVALRLAVAFITVQFTIILLLLSILLVRKIAGQIEEKRVRRLFPVIREKLAEYTLGQQRLSGLRHLHHSYPTEFESCLIDFLPTISGEGSKRLSQLACDLGLVTKWEKQARSKSVSRRQEAIMRLCQLTSSTVRMALVQALYDSELDIRIEACRALIRLSQPEEINRIFNYAITQPPIVCSVLVEELRPHALMLASGAISEGLRSDDHSQVISTLAVIVAWRRALPLPEVALLLWHSNPKVRTAAFRVLNYVACEIDPIPAVLDGLNSPDPLVKMGAARACGRLKIEAATPTLILFLHETHKGIARAAAYALCELGAEGMKVLEDEVQSSNQTAAKLALEALECVRVGRYEYARLE